MSETINEAFSHTLGRDRDYAGFVSWLTAPMYSAEVKAGMIHELHVDELDHERSFAAYHRREGILPRPAASFLDQVRTLAAALS